MKHITLLLSLLVLALVPEAFSQTASKRAFGWKPDPPGIAKRQFKSLGLRAETIQPFTDIRSMLPAKTYDQGTLGSCTANGGIAAFNAPWKTATGKFYAGSRLGLYYYSRLHDGTVNEDAGSYISTVMKVMTRQGIGAERCWPYDIRKFTQKPGSCYNSVAAKHRLAQGLNLDNTDGKSIRIALSNGMPVVFGCYVYSGIDFVAGPDYILAMPRKGEPPQGGHCMVIVGHDDVKKLYLVRNSWGDGWAKKGHFYMPYAYIHNGRLAEDFWAVGLVLTP